MAKKETEIFTFENPAFGVLAAHLLPRIVDEYEGAEDVDYIGGILPLKPWARLLSGRSGLVLGAWNLGDQGWVPVEGDYSAVVLPKPGEEDLWFSTGTVFIVQSRYLMLARKCASPYPGMGDLSRRGRLPTLCPPPELWEEGD